MRQEKEQIAEAFYIEAKSDLKMAELAYENDIYSRCVSMSQQVVEKSLKTALAMVGAYVRQHEVSSYFLKEFKEIIDANLISEISILTRVVESDWVRSRYPDWENREKPIWIPSKQYSKDDAEKALSVARRIHEIIKDILESKFQLEL